MFDSSPLRMIKGLILTIYPEPALCTVIALPFSIGDDVLASGASICVSELLKILLRDQDLPVKGLHTSVSNFMFLGSTT